MWCTYKYKMCGKGGFVLLMLLLCMELNAQEACSTQMLMTSYKAVVKSDSPENMRKFFAAFPSTGEDFDVLFGYHPCVGDSSLYDSYVEMIDDFWALRAIPDSVFYDKVVAITCGLRYDADAQSLWHDHLLDILTRRGREAERLIDRVALLRRGHQMQFWSFVWSAIVDVDDRGKRDFHRAYIVGHYPRMAEIYDMAHQLFYDGINFSSISPRDYPN